MNVQDFYNILSDNGVDCFCGVPDSLLKNFCAYVTDNAKNHTITANEGNAVALAAGHYLATGRPALVYMQNSGIGNCVNPLLSLIDEEVYNIPLLMLIGWRGEPDKKDEPQHVKQGKVTNKLLEVMGIRYEILPENFDDAKPLVEDAFKYMKDTKCPFAFIVRKGLFEDYKLQNKVVTPYEFRREDAIETVIKELTSSDVIVSTTGHISREVYETRERLGQGHKQDFLTVGSMGHSSSIALGIALDKPDRTVYCFDGDGALLMHTGALIVNASKKLNNFKHIVFNNEAHDSVGSQPTTINSANLKELALNSGYKKAYSVKNKKELLKVLPKFINDKCTTLLEIKVKCGARADLGRPKEKPWENKKLFMDNLNQVEFCYRGAIKELNTILKQEQAKKVLIFRGKKSYETIKHIVEPQLKGVKVTYYNAFSTNPKKEEIDIARGKLGGKYDLIITIGGGSVMDFAKAYRYYAQINAKLIAVPTTCGTGAESTQFAVVYIDGVKTSLDDESILPDYAIVDSQFCENNPKYLKACSAMDAYCQSIESFWAVKATDESREYAKQAIKLCRDNVVKYVNSFDSDAAGKMVLASHLAGKAINISRTTASHAISYKITSDYGIPHGHAVALTIAKLFKKNLESGMYDELKDLITNEPITYFKELFEQIGLEFDLTKLGITDIQSIVDNVNIERLSNNPVKLFKEDIINLLK
ncbi:phosphonopyruvate decarboxylase [bacterium]|nr:phosphonopyruvate decarboxylase [bacterium]